jgi:hypothetical protein
MHVRSSISIRDLSDGDYRGACDGFAPVFADVPDWSRTAGRRRPTPTADLHVGRSRGDETFATSDSFKGRRQPELRQHHLARLRGPRPDHASGSPPRPD